MESKSEKPKVSYSITTLAWLSDEALAEIIRSDNYDDDTKKLARRVINQRESEQ